LVIIGGTTELLSFLVKGEQAPLSFYTFDLFIICIWFFVINGIYVGLHYYREYTSVAETRQEQARLKAGGVRVRLGKQELLLSYEEIQGMFVDGDYVAVIDSGGKRHFLDLSLDKLEEALPSSWFFRLNRQYIVHRQLVTGFERAENGKIQVMLSPGSYFPPHVTVSRTKAPSFKEWFRPE
jgi:DNA-binding LytR/AlgR family response regulator